MTVVNIFEDTGSAVANIKSPGGERPKKSAENFTVVMGEGRRLMGNQFVTVHNNLVLGKVFCREF